jgi:hypothetical protein
MVGPIGLHGAYRKNANRGHTKGCAHMGDACINTDADPKIRKPIAKGIEMLNWPINHFNFAIRKRGNLKATLALRLGSRHQCNLVTPSAERCHNHTHPLVIQLLSLFGGKGHEQGG